MDKIHRDEQLLSKFREAQLKADQAKFNPTSQRIVAAKQISFLHEVFSLLDSDQDGVISSTNLDITRLPENVLEGISPLLVEMEEAKVWLDWEEFRGAGEKLMRMMGGEERRRMMEGGKRKREGEILKFQVRKRKEKGLKLIIALIFFNGGKFLLIFIGRLLWIFLIKIKNYF